MMLSHLYSFLLTSVFLSISFLYGQEIPNSKLFLEKFKPFAGQYFEGEVITGAKEGDAFFGKKLIMHIASYNDREVKIPFFVGEDKSRTWIISYSNEVLTLKHYHRHQDGSPDKIIYYGGTATNSGQDSIQVFPADAETCHLIDYACQNVWWITMDGRTYTYNLRRIGSDRVFTVKFDLLKPVQSNFKPW